ncbi:MAG: hypothetical protein MI751_06585 [Pseudomonadales bacterium]|uniref:hypothetical protein n=1 Tax=Alcanivorax sp. MD8A TaxID=1177157 RepID=UPI000C9CC0D4|nr:hypothetical protein [Alcanivorax sp. MD8A]MCG8437732.1 hypothetical protein [Pseudomonadales bacterium]MEE2869449.1 hypothetical protein [Pseudomonadota bacterium]PNE02035.1 hypothetical protein A15D_02353 [Alcanivorax sp. MD8A]
MNLVARLSCLLTLALLLTACSQNPDTGEARKVLEAELENAHLAELLEIAAVEKHNGYEDGNGLYTIEVSYELEARESLSDYANQVKADESLSGMDRFAMIMALSALRVEYGNFQKGDTFEEQRVLTFRETEKGWKVVE